ncbi:MAG: alpha/beta fold hydrolase [Verrucomicrobiota bacterium]|nr:alpha/beta fold hydrolase [Verrucomicrobiota bacterium]
MKLTPFKVVTTLLLVLACSRPLAHANRPPSGKYAEINGLKMYYQIEGEGKPLVYMDHTIITLDLQGHGRTADIADRPLSIEQHSKDVVALVKYLKISKADFMGESYGGAIAAMIAIRNPELVILCGLMAFSGCGHIFGTFQSYKFGTSAFIWSLSGSLACFLIAALNSL